MSSGNFSDLDAVKRANLVRLMDEKRIYAAELAKLYGEEGCTPQFISALLKGKSLIGDEVVKALSKALACDPLEFYRVDFMMKDWDGISAETVRVLQDVKEILERGDERTKTHLTRRIAEYKETAGREVMNQTLTNQVQSLIERIEKLEKLLGSRRTGAKAQS